MNINLILITIAIIWLLIVTSFLIWFYFSLKNIIKDSKDKNFLKTLKNIQELQQKNLKDILNLNLAFESFRKESKSNLHKIGLVKYNPFKETGGNNSFSLVLLDSNNNGIIITSLHTRERTRLYLKKVKLGQPDVELSGDEAKALKEALR